MKIRRSITELESDYFSAKINHDGDFTIQEFSQMQPVKAVDRLNDLINFINEISDNYNLVKKSEVEKNIPAKNVLQNSTKSNEEQVQNFLEMIGLVDNNPVEDIVEGDIVENIVALDKDDFNIPLSDIDFSNWSIEEKNDYLMRRYQSKIKKIFSPETDEQGKIILNADGTEKYKMVFDKNTGKLVPLVKEEIYLGNMVQIGKETATLVPEEIAMIQSFHIPVDKKKRPKLILQESALSINSGAKPLYDGNSGKKLAGRIQL